MHTIPVAAPLVVNLRNAWSKVKQEGSCWIWTGATRHGYAAFDFADKKHRAHRVFFTWFKYEIPEGLTLDHLCRNKLCVNPDHLEAVTQKENINRTPKCKWCKRGHPLADPNLYHFTSGDGRKLRRCLQCMKGKAEAARAARRARGLKRPGRKPILRTTD